MSPPCPLYTPFHMFTLEPFTVPSLSVKLSAPACASAYRGSPGGTLETICPPDRTPARWTAARRTARPPHPLDRPRDRRLPGFAKPDLLSGAPLCKILTNFFDQRTIDNFFPYLCIKRINVLGHHPGSGPGL